MLVVNNGLHLRALGDEPQVHNHPRADASRRAEPPDCRRFTATLAYIGVGEKLDAI